MSLKFTHLFVIGASFILMTGFGVWSLVGVTDAVLQQAVRAWGIASLAMAGILTVYAVWFFQHLKELP